MTLLRSSYRPPKYALASILCSFGGFLFGMDTGIIGSVVVMPSYTAEFGNVSPAVRGLIVSSILIPAAIASFFAGKGADTFGRPYNIAMGAVIFGLGCALEAGAVHIAMFIVGRVIEGLGEGQFLGTLVVYICEISPISKRGPLTSGPQLMITIGLMFGFFLCYGTVTIESSIGWRITFVVLSCLAFTFAAMSAICLPASPRWLCLRGHPPADIAKAWETLEVDPNAASLADPDEEKSRDLQIDKSSPREHNDQNKESSSKGDNHDESRQSSITLTPSKHPALDLFAPDVRSRTILGAFLLAMQQLCGIDGVLYAGIDAKNANFLASGISAILLLGVTIPGVLFSDRWGRRASTILGGFGLAFFMLVIGSLYAADAVHSNSGAGRWVVVVSIYLYVAVFGISWSIGIRIFVAESQPQRTRASATNLAHGANWLSNFVVAMTTPVMLARSDFSAYFLFGGCSLITAFVCIAYMPETRGRSLEQIEEDFNRKSVLHGKFKWLHCRSRKGIKVSS